MLDEGKGAAGLDNLGAASLHLCDSLAAESVCCSAPRDAGQALRSVLPFGFPDSDILAREQRVLRRTLTLSLMMGQGRDDLSRSSHRITGQEPLHGGSEPPLK